MKLKTIVASLVALGLSAPVLAAPRYMDTSYQLDVMRSQMNGFNKILNKNQPGRFGQPCGWTCRINLSGWINTDAYFGNRPPVFFNFNPAFNAATAVSPTNLTLIPTTGRASDLVLNNANLFVDAQVNNWVTANMSMVYSSLVGVPGSTGSYNIANSLFVYHPISKANLDTAYATIGNLQTSPVYFRVGKAYAPFGQYEGYSFVRSENPTHLFTEINKPLAQVGFITPAGFYGSAYTFAGNPKLSDGGSTRRIQNGGLDLGYGWKRCNKRLDINAGLIANIADSNFLSSYYLNSIIEGTNVPGLPDGKVPAWDVNADLKFGSFDINGHYIATTRSLANPVFLSGFTPSTATPPQTVEPGFLGKSKVWGLEAGFTFPGRPCTCNKSRIALGWQRTSHLATFLPKKRYYIDYLASMTKWFDMGIAIIQDSDYSTGEGAISDSTGAQVYSGATGNKSTFGQVRASIKFA